MKEIVLEREKLIGAIKVMDGLFMGDILASQDLEFITSNSVNSIVNTSIELPNTFESYGVEYLNLNWIQNIQSPLFKSYSELENSFKFVSEKMKKKECVLVISTYGKNRCGTFLILYLMQRFRWSYGMTLQFIQSRRFDVKIKKSYLEGIKDLQKDMVTFGRGALTYQWGVPSNQKDSEEVLVMHTYLNTLLRQNSSNLGVIIERRGHEEEEEEEKKEVKWRDRKKTGEKETKKKELVTIIPEFNHESVKDELKKLKESDKTGTFYISGDTSYVKEGSILKMKTNNSVTEKNIVDQISSLNEDSISKDEREMKLKHPEKPNQDNRRENIRNIQFKNKKSRSDSPKKRKEYIKERASSLLPMSSNSIFLRNTNYYQRKESNGEIFEEEHPKMIEFFMTEQPKLKTFLFQSLDVRGVKNNTRYHIKRKILKLERRKLKREKKKQGLDFGDCERIYRNHLAGISS